MGNTKNARGAVTPPSQNATIELLTNNIMCTGPFSGMKIDRTDPTQYIVATVSVKDQGGAPVANETVLVTVSPTAWELFDLPQKANLPQGNDGYYVTTDNNGEATFGVGYAWGQIAQLSTALADTGEGVSTPIVCNGNPINKVWLPPISGVPTDENTNTVLIPEDKQSFTVWIPPTGIPLKVGYMAVFLQTVDNDIPNPATLVYSGSYDASEDSGNARPISYLSLDNRDGGLNRIWYVLESPTGNTNKSQVLEFKASGEPMRHPLSFPPDAINQQRTLDMVPFLVDHADLINQASIQQDVIVNIPLDQTGNNTVIPGITKVGLDVYVNAFQFDTDVPKGGIFHAVQEHTSTVNDVAQKQVQLLISRIDLMGFATSRDSNLGKIEIDYYFTDDNGKTKRYPKQWFSGVIDTVGLTGS